MPWSSTEGPAEKGHDQATSGDDKIDKGAPDPFGAPHAPHALASAAPQQCHTAAQRERAADAEGTGATRKCWGPWIAQDLGLSIPANSRPPKAHRCGSERYAALNQQQANQCRIQRRSAHATYAEAFQRWFLGHSISPSKRCEERSQEQHEELEEDRHRPGGAGSGRKPPLRREFKCLAARITPAQYGFAASGAIML